GAVRVVRGFLRREAKLGKRVAARICWLIQKRWERKKPDERPETAGSVSLADIAPRADGQPLHPDRHRIDWNGLGTL
ncbi:MAG TPA: hypothetical protein VFY85_06375, partial [Gemmatimonadaceae bacterium]|nr:hypothetical protein [Gemmatimonadaceae bacterium]